VSAPPDATALTAKDLGWPAWDQERAERIEAEALKSSLLALGNDRERVLACRKELDAAGIPFEEWRDPRLPGLDYPLIKVLLPGERQAIIGTPARANAFCLGLLAGRRGLRLLIGGRTGSGKELVARLYHKASRDRNKRPREPFVGFNCAALPGGIVEAEPFGAVENAASSFAKRDGLFNAAHGGTIFLDEIGELPLEIQAKVLRVVQYGLLRKLGDPREIHVDVQIVAATNRDLWSEVTAGRFRGDLFHRLNVMSVELPPLVSCREEILPLAYLMLDRYCALDGSTLTYSFTPLALRALRTYSWPGNIRELENVVQKAVALGANPIPVEHLQLPNVISDLSFRRPADDRFTHEQLEAIQRMRAQKIGGDKTFRMLRGHHGFSKSRSTFFRYLRDFVLVAPDVSRRRTRHDR
jgi:DNA-binding NtrC family response regulator